MFTPDVQVHDFSAQDWLRLTDLFRSPAPPSEGEGEARPSGGIFAVRDGQRLVKVTSTVRGRLPLPDAAVISAAGLAELHDSAFAIVISRLALEQFGDRFARRLTRELSFYGQVEAIVEALRELEREGELQLWPDPAAEWPLPTERAFVSALDLICPDGKVVVLGAFEGGELYTALCLRRRGGAFDAVMGPDRVRRDMGLLSGDFSRDYRYLGAAVESRLGPLAVGCYADLGTFRRLARSAEPGAWAAAVASRDVILTPVTPGLAVPLGVDAGRAVLSLAKGLVGRLGIFGGSGASRLSPNLAPHLERVYALVESDVRRYLGFDPWRVLTRWFQVPR
jgi:hypothetical protein